MGLSLALIVMGILIILDRMGTAYGFREGWPWIVVALGAGGLLRNMKSLPAWITTLIGIFILNASNYPIQIKIPGGIRTYFLPVLLITLGLIWLWKYKKD